MRPPARWPARALLAVVAGTVLAVGALALEEPRRATVEDMDMGLLQRNLLKIYVCEKEAFINAKALDSYKFAAEAAGAGRVTLERPTEDQLKEMREREKDISHYLLFDKTNAVQMIQIVDRILGTDTHLVGEGRAERVILDRKVELIEIPRGPKGGTDIREAARIIGEVLGCAVKVEQPDTEIYRLWFTMGPTTGDAIIKQVCSSQPFNWRFVNGVLIFRHRDLAAGESGKSPPGGTGGTLGEEDRRLRDKEREEAERRGE